MLWWVSYRILLVVSTVSVFAVTMIGAILQTDAKHWGFLETTLKLTQDWAWLLIIVLSLVTAACAGLIQFLGPPWVWDSVRETLNRIRDRAFTGIDGDPTHHHRVTLFRRKWCWYPPSPARHRFWSWGIGTLGPRGPWSGWMVPVMRSGHTTRQCWTVYLASDRDVESSEGIVGLAWQTNQVQIMELPEITGLSTLDQIADYARRAMVSPSFVGYRVKAGKACPRTLCAIPVEVNNRIWGVIVLDSRRTGTINYQAPEWAAHLRFAPQTLADMLKGV